MKTEQINELAKALVVAQKNITGAKLDSKNPFYKSKYADLTSVVASCRKELSENGLSYVQLLNRDDYGDYVETVLMHVSGQFVTSQCYLRFKEDDMQKLGAAITYARRYSLMAIVGIAPEDDDGNSCSPQVSKPVYANKETVLKEIEAMLKMVDDAEKRESIGNLVDKADNDFKKLKTYHARLKEITK